MDDCVFCAIAVGSADADLAVRISDRVFVLPPIRQRPRNRGHALVLPVGHVRNLHDARPDLLAELMGVVTDGCVPAALRRHRVVRLSEQRRG
jgi:diadenosine tetraphosphate (Ap4A) HIT family hydrolase